MSKSLVVLPSYNERENIWQLVESLLNQSSTIYICIVDDNSPDGTPVLLQEKIHTLSVQDKSRVHLIVRSKKDGRGGAVRDGFIWGLSDQTKENFDTFIEMDCDFSHDPVAIAEGLKLIQSHDVVIGARYPNGEIVGWPLKRRVMSFFANTLARTLISWKISDYTNGFRFYSRSAASHLIRQPQKHKGYIYLSESLAYLLKDGFSVGSFPIRFVNRERGVSNTTFAEVAAAFRGIFTIALEYHRGSAGRALN